MDSRRRPCRGDECIGRLGAKCAGLRWWRNLSCAAYNSSAAARGALGRLADARRLREQQLASDDALVTMGIALTETGLLPFEQTIAEARSAREMGVPMVLHTGCSWGLRATEGVPELEHHGLLGPDQVHVHCNTLDERDFRRLASAVESGKLVAQTGL